MSAFKVHAAALSLVNSALPAGSVFLKNVDFLDEYKVFLFGSLNDLTGDHACFDPAAGAGNLFDKVAGACTKMMALDSRSAPYRLEIYKICHWTVDCLFHIYQCEHGKKVEYIFEPAGEFFAGKRSVRLAGWDVDSVSDWMDSFRRRAKYFQHRYAWLGKNPLATLLFKKKRDAFAESIDYVIGKSAEFTAALVRFVERN